MSFWLMIVHEITDDLYYVCMITWKQIVYMNKFMKNNVNQGH